MVSSFSSSSDIEDQIDALITEATDLCTLETIASLNTAHLSDSSLSPNLETRFQKVKSFPPPTTTSTSLLQPIKSLPPTTTIQESHCFNPRKTDLGSSNEPAKSETKEEKKPRRGWSLSPSPSPSPPRRRQICGCFSFSPKKVQRRGRSGGRDSDDSSDILSGFGSESMKESRRKLKMACREQEKANKEAEKMVKWVKQVSQKINEAAIDELMKEEFMGSDQF